MKKFLFLIVSGLIIFQFSVSAQQANQKDFYWKKIERFNNMKHMGVGMTIGGTILTVIGIGVISDAANSYDSNSYYNTDENENKMLLGILTTELGCGVAAGGVVLWTIGASKKNKYTAKMKSLSFNLNTDPLHKLSLTYNF